LREPAEALLFVYGTLKTGEARHDLVQPFLRAVEPALVEGFTLWTNGSYPGARPSPGDVVEGELLTLSTPQEALPLLDAYEDHPEEYLRRQVPVRAGEQTQTAWFYELIDLEDGPWSPLGASWPG
jgi:gamma-glutamylcyclotransferase (GGCT)/AIG2-like uncharacterized protein YtfP